MPVGPAECSRAAADAKSVRCQEGFQDWHQRLKQRLDIDAAAGEGAGAAAVAEMAIACLFLVRRRWFFLVSLLVFRAVLLSPCVCFCFFL